MGVLSNEKIMYLHVTCGLLKGKDIETRGYEGMFESIERIEDEYEKKKIKKIALRMYDPKTNEKVLIKWTLKSWFTVTFFSRILNIDLTQPFVVGVYGSEENEKVSFCWMRQNGAKIEKDSSFPKPVKREVGGEEIYDYEAVIAKADELIKLMNSIDYQPPKPTVEPPDEVRDPEYPPEADQGPTDDLPF